MSPYKSFIAATKAYFNSVTFLKFLLSAYIFLFAFGGLFYLLGAFILTVYEPFAIIGITFMYAGLLLTVIQEDDLTLVITSGIISLGSLIAWIIALASLRGYAFFFGPLFFFLVFGAITAIGIVKGEKFKQMRAASATRGAGIACPRCGAYVPVTSAFCPSCGAQNPAYQQYTPPAQPQYAPPQPQYAPPAQPQSAPPAGETAPPEQPATVKCVNCGTDLPAGSTFCGKCGSKQ